MQPFWNAGNHAVWNAGNHAASDMAQMQQQMQQNPEMMRQMMSNPMMQEMMGNPEVVRSRLTSNPQVSCRECVLFALQLIRRRRLVLFAIQLIRLPWCKAIMLEMQRNQDRAMSNIEAHPEGFFLEGGTMERRGGTLDPNLLFVQSRSARCRSRFGPKVIVLLPDDPVLLLHWAQTRRAIILRLVWFINALWCFCLWVIFDLTVESPEKSVWNNPLKSMLPNNRLIVVIPI